MGLGFAGSPQCEEYIFKVKSNHDNHNEQQRCNITMCRVPAGLTDLQLQISLPQFDLDVHK